MISISAAVVLFLVFLILSSAIKVLREYERGVVFRLGRAIGATLRKPSVPLSGSARLISRVTGSPRSPLSG